MGPSNVYSLDQSSIQALVDILNVTRSTGEGVDVVDYRAQHEDQRTLLDELERNEYLCKVNEKYWITLNGLTVLNNQDVKDLLERCEKIFLVLRNHYKATPKENMKVVDLANAADLTFKETAECLGYMMKAWCWSSYSNSFQDPAEAFIRPSERILDHKTFQEVRTELKKLRDNRQENKETATFPNKDIEMPDDAMPILQGSVLHPKIVEAALSQFETHHYRDAILNAFIAVFDYIRERTGLDLDGENLINTAFSLNRPLLLLNKLKTQSDRNEQLGFMDIFKGAYKGIRSPKAHSLITQLSSVKAYEYLIFASLLARRIEEAKLVSSRIKVKTRVRRNLKK